MLYGFFGLGMQELLLLAMMALVPLTIVIVVLIVMNKSSGSGKPNEGRDVDDRV